MTARDLGGIAGKSLAVYLAVQAIQYGSMTAYLLQPAMRFATRRPNPNWPNYAVPAVLFAVGALVLWWSARRFWPSDAAEEPPIEVKDVKRVALSVLGTYFLVIYGGQTIVDAINLSQATAFVGPGQNPRWMMDCGVTLVGLALVIANMKKKEPVPGFDDFH